MKDGELTDGFSKCGITGVIECYVHVWGALMLRDISVSAVASLSGCSDLSAHI